MSTALMAFEGVSFGYEARRPPVLSGLSLELKAGATTAILGPNGAGKTTLLHLALGWLKPRPGEIRLADLDLRSYRRQELGRWMALVPQGEHIPFEYSVLEYVLLGRAPHLPPLGMPGARDYAAALAALEQAGIGNLHDRSVLALSGGEHQLLLVARALAQQPRLLLLDEPTAHLDLSNKTRLIRIIKDLHVSGVTILMTSHEPEVVLASADEVVLMETGRVLASGPVDATLTEENLSRTYGISIRVVAHDGTKHVVWV